MSRPLEDDIEGPRKRPRLDKADGRGSPLVGDEAEELDEHQKELRSGIDAFISPKTQGFSAVFKQRYADFLVNEILLSGEVLHLTDDVSFQEPEEAGGDATALEKPDNSSEPEPAPVGAHESKQITAPNASTVQPEPVVDIEPAQPFKLNAEQRSALDSIFDETTTSETVRLYNTVLQNPQRRRKDFARVISPVIEDKEMRTRAHNTVREIFGSMIETTTNDDNTITLLPAISSLSRKKKDHWKSQRQPETNQSLGKLGWNDLGGEYLHFTLYKENKDTMEAIGYLCSRMKLHTKHFQFSGTKDKRAVTVQRISALRVPISRLTSLAPTLRNATIGGFKYEPTPLGLGQLGGNEFQIVLRDCHFPGEQGLELKEREQLGRHIVATAVNQISSTGFINYYGLQRFGSFATSTDQVGLKLLQGDLEGAIDLILGYSPHTLAVANGEKESPTVPADDRKRAKALHIWKTERNSKRALEILPRKFGAETAIIRYMGHKKGHSMPHSRDFQGALAGIQRNLRLMYVHAYQSLVWNKAAGRRWETFGDKVVAGDLVIVSKPEEILQSVDEAGELIVQPDGNDGSRKDDRFERARPITESEAEAKTFTVFDVVLPLPGFDVEYPQNEIGKFYQDFMGSEEGGGLDPYEMRRKWKDISLSGGYRKLLAQPSKVEWDFKTYTSDTEQLIETDLDRLTAAGKSSGHSGRDLAQEAAESDTREVEKLAVILKMQLGPSQYATMALRELLKGGGLKPFKAELPLSA